MSRRRRRRHRYHPGPPGGNGSAPSSPERSTPLVPSTGRPATPPPTNLDLAKALLQRSRSVAQSFGIVVRKGRAIVAFCNCLDEEAAADLHRCLDGLMRQYAKDPDDGDGDVELPVHREVAPAKPERRTTTDRPVPARALREPTPPPSNGARRPVSSAVFTPPKRSDEQPRQPKNLGYTIPRTGPKPLPPPPADVSTSIMGADDRRDDELEEILRENRREGRGR